MLFSRTAEYALRTMTHLARLGASANVRARDLAEAVAVPGPYQSKILRRLTAAGLLTSQKGHGGGFALAAPPSQIRFVDILRAADFDPAPDRCVFGWEECDATRPCPLHPEWSALKEAVEEWARTRTLADVLDED